MSTSTKARSWVNQQVDAAKDEVQKGVDWVKTEGNTVVDDVKKDADWVATKAKAAVDTVKKDADAVKTKALGDQSGKPIPRPMEPDCKPEHGYVPGPKNHLLCATHGMSSTLTPGRSSPSPSPPISVAR